MGLGNLFQGQDFLRWREDLLDPTERSCSQGLNYLILADVMGIFGS